MKKHILFVLIILSFVSPSFAQKEKVSYKTVADIFESNYNADNFESVFVTFSLESLKTLPIEITKEFLSGLKQQVGKITNREFIKYENSYASYKTTFEKASFILNISVNDNYKINGLLVKPYKFESKSSELSLLLENESNQILKTHCDELL